MRPPDKSFAAGFTLVELVVVLVVLAIAASMVTVSVPAAGGHALESAAERLASALESARWQAISTSGRIAWEAPQAGASTAAEAHAHMRWYYQAADGTWRLRVTNADQSPLAGATVLMVQPRSAAGAPARLVLGPEPVGVAACIVLSLDGATAAVVSDGIAPFAVRRNVHC